MSTQVPIIGRVHRSGTRPGDVGLADTTACRQRYDGLGGQHVVQPQREDILRGLLALEALGLVTVAVVNIIVATTRRRPRRLA